MKISKFLLHKLILGGSFFGLVCGLSLFGNSPASRDGMPGFSKVEASEPEEEEQEQEQEQEYEQEGNYSGNDDAKIINELKISKDDEEDNEKNEDDKGSDSDEGDSKKVKKPRKAKKNPKTKELNPENESSNKRNSKKNITIDDKKNVIKIKSFKGDDKFEGGETYEDEDHDNDFLDASVNKKKFNKNEIIISKDYESGEENEFEEREDVDLNEFDQDEYGDVDNFNINDYKGEIENEIKQNNEKKQLDAKREEDLANLESQPLEVNFLTNLLGDCIDRLTSIKTSLKTLPQDKNGVISDKKIIGSIDELKNTIAYLNISLLPDISGQLPEPKEVAKNTLKSLEDAKVLLDDFIKDNSKILGEERLELGDILTDAKKTVEEIGKAIVNLKTIIQNQQFDNIFAVVQDYDSKYAPSVVTKTIGAYNNKINAAVIKDIQTYEGELDKLYKDFPESKEVQLILDTLGANARAFMKNSYKKRMKEANDDPQKKTHAQRSNLCKHLLFVILF